VQTITSRHWKVAPKHFRFGFIVTSALDYPPEPDESIEHTVS
jgi:hypothetical protein